MSSLRGLLASKLARGSAWLTVSMIGSLALQAAYFVVLARTLGPYNFGIFGAALAAVSLAAPFSTWGSGNLLVRDAAVRSDLLGALRRRALATTVIAGGCLLLAIMALGLILSTASQFLITLGVLGLAELFFARVVEVNGQCFQSQDHYKMTGLMQALVSGARLGAAVVLAAAVRTPSPAVWALLYLAGTVIAALISTCLVKCILAPGGESEAIAGWSLRSGFFFSLGSASKTAYSDLDKVMLLRLAGPSENGIYTAAYRIITLALAPVRAVILGSNTKFYRAGVDGPRSTYRLALRLLPAVSGYGVFASGAMLLAAPLLPLVLGPSYNDAASALRWLALMPLVEGIHYLFGDALMGAGRQQARSLLQLGTVVLNFGLNLFLIPLYTWRGAAVASLVSESALAIAAFFLLHRLGRSAGVRRPEPSVP